LQVNGDEVVLDRMLMVCGGGKPGRHHEMPFCPTPPTGPRANEPAVFAVAVQPLAAQTHRVAVALGLKIVTNCEGEVGPVAPLVG
jgi:hypothetical protein